MDDGQSWRPGYGGTTDAVWPYTSVIAERGGRLSNQHTYCSYVDTTHTMSVHSSAEPSETPQFCSCPSLYHIEAEVQLPTISVISTTSREVCYSFFLTSCHQILFLAGGDHPSPTTSKGRGVPEIDLLAAEHNKLDSGQVFSQSEQLALITVMGIASLTNSRFIILPLCSTHK